MQTTEELKKAFSWRDTITLDSMLDQIDVAHELPELVRDYIEALFREQLAHNLNAEVGGNDEEVAALVVAGRRAFTALAKAQAEHDAYHTMKS